MTDKIIHIFAWPAQASYARIQVRKSDVDHFERDLLSKLKKLGYIENYRKQPRSWYLSNKKQFQFLIESDLCKISCRPESKGRLGL